VCRVAVSIKRKYNCRSPNACHSLPCPSPSRSCVLFPGIVSHAHAHGQSVVVLDTASYMYRNRVDSTHPLFDPGPRRLRHPQQPPLLGPVGVSQPHESMPSPARPCSQALHSRPPPTPPRTDEAHNKTSHLVHISFTRHVSSRLLTHVPRPSSGVIRRHQASSAVIRRHQASDQTESPSGVISHHQASSGVRPDGGVISHHQASSGVRPDGVAIRRHQPSSGVIRRPTRRSRHQPPCCRSYGRRHPHHQHRHRRFLLRCRQRHRSPQWRPRPPPPLRRA
jgi:hypothetical protein